MERGYEYRIEDTRAPSGKLDFAGTLQSALPRRGQVRVRRSRLSADILHNRIVRTTVLRLSAAHGIDRSLRNRLMRLARRMPVISPIKAQPGIFRQVHIHRNNAEYAFLLHLCELVCRRLHPSGNGGFYFREFRFGDKDIGHLFEDFVRNFFRQECADIGVSRTRRTMEWDARAIGEQVLRLPQLRTDIFIPGASGRSVIIETKAHTDVAQSRPAAVQQIFAYLANHHRRHPTAPPALGVLLFATLGDRFRERHVVHERHQLWIRSLDLKAPRQAIRKEMQELASDLRA